MDRSMAGEVVSRQDTVLEEIRSHSHLLVRLAENTLIVAESLRENYIRNTAVFVSRLRRAMDAAEKGLIQPAFMIRQTLPPVEWSDLKGEEVTFIDGGIGSIRIARRSPLLLRVGSYTVRTGEHNLSERERFGYYPVILGDLEGGSHDRPDFAEVVRITAELLGGLSVLERTPDLRILMFHGPLVYPIGSYAGHAPFLESDIDLFLRHYAGEPGLGERLKEEFLREAALDTYPRMAPDRCDVWIERRLFEPLAWIAFLFRRLVSVAESRSPVTILLGVVERDDSSEFLRRVLLGRLFRHLRSHGNADFFNRTFGRSDLTSPKMVVDRLSYTDNFLLALLLDPGQITEPWEMRKYDGLKTGRIVLPGESFETQVNWECLRPPSPVGFPPVTGAYLHVSTATEPIRIEVFGTPENSTIVEAARRVFLYSKALPGYGFPVGLDIADRYAKVPAWLTEAYGKLIRFHLGVSLQQGEMTDAEMRRLLIQAIYVNQRDWLFRPKL